MQEADAGAADREGRKEKVEINFLERRSLLRFRYAYTRFSRCLGYQRGTASSGYPHICTPLRDKGKGSSGRNDLRNFARAAKIPSCAPMIDLIQRNTSRAESEGNRGGGVRFQLGPPREDKELSGVAEAASRKLTISHRSAGDLTGRVLRLGQPRAG